MHLPVNAVFAWGGIDARKTYVPTCCGQNAVTAWKLDSNEPLYISGGIEVEPSLFSIERISGLPQNCRDLQNFNQLCHHLILSEGELHGVLDLLTEIFNGEAKLIKDVWQIYVLNEPISGIYKYIDKDCLTTLVTKDDLRERFTEKNDKQS